MSLRTGGGTGHTECGRCQSPEQDSAQLLQIRPRERLPIIGVRTRLSFRLGIFSTGPSASSSSVWSTLCYDGSLGVLVQVWDEGVRSGVGSSRRLFRGALTNTTIHQSAPGIRAEGRWPCRAPFGGADGSDGLSSITFVM